MIMTIYVLEAFRAYKHISLIPIGLAQVVPRNKFLANQLIKTQLWMQLK